MFSYLRKHFFLSIEVDEKNQALTFTSLYSEIDFENIHIFFEYFCFSTFPSVLTPVGAALPFPSLLGAGLLVSGLMISSITVVFLECRVLC